MAARPSKSKDQQAQKAKDAGKRTHVMASVRLDVATYAKVSAIAALRGVDKSSFMSRVIMESVRSVVVFDRSIEARGKVDPADSDTGEDRQDDAA